MRRILQMACGMLAIFACLAYGRPARAFICGGCFGGPPPTLSQQLFDADGAYLARIVSKTEFVVKDDDGEEYTGHYTTFELVETLKPGLADVAPRMHVILDYEHDGLPGDYAVLMGSRLTADEDPFGLYDDDSEELTVDITDLRESKPLFSEERDSTEINWTATETLTWDGYEYLRHLPSPLAESPDGLPSERLAYFLPFLEHPDDVVAEDAYDELNRAEFADLIPLADRLPREKLAKWMINSEDSGLFRRRLYGIMLGLCGQREDAALLRKIALTVPSEDDEDGVELIGIEGAIIGFLMLTGERGLADLTDNVLTRHAASPDSVFHLLDALRFLFHESPETIPADTLRTTLRRTLDRQDSAGTAIEYLSELDDWGSQERVIGLIDACGYESDEIRLAIVRYLQASAGNIADPALRPIAERAVAVLADLKRREPQLFDESREWETLRF